MKRALVCGAGNNFVYSFAAIEAMYEVVGVADNSEEKHGRRYFGYEVRKPDEYAGVSFDYAILTPSDSHSLKKQLAEAGIPEERILSLGEALDPKESDSKLRIAILLYGGMGDFIIGKNWLFYLNKKFELGKEDLHLYFDKDAQNCIDSFYADCDWISAKYVVDYSSSSLVRGEYDLVFRFSIFPYVQKLNDERVHKCKKELYEYADGIRKFGLENYVPGFFSSPYFYKTVDKIFSKHPERKYHTHFDVCGSLGADGNYLCRIPVRIKEDYLSAIGLESKRFITIDTGLNQEYIKKTNVRAWKHKYWDRLAQKIKSKYPDMKIVQMGLSTGRCEDIQADLNLNGKTDLEQAKVLLLNSLLHIDYEGGLIHLRHVLGGGVSIVLMGPTSEQIHNYPENIAIRTSVCASPCEWTGQDWLVHCQKGYMYPKCMESITPDIVMEKVDLFMEKIARLC